MGGCFVEGGGIFKESTYMLGIITKMITTCCGIANLVKGVNWVTKELFCYVCLRQNEKQKGNKR